MRIKEILVSATPLRGSPGVNIWGKTLQGKPGNALEYYSILLTNNIVAAVHSKLKGR